MKALSLCRRAAIGAMLAAGEAGARAGGGSHSAPASGGGHSSASHGGVGYVGGGSGGGGGGGISFGTILLLVVLALVIYFLYRRYAGSSGGDADRGDGRDNDPPGGGLPGAALGAAVGAVAADYNAGRAVPMGVGARPTAPEALTAIQATDPAFEIESFMQRAEMTFFLVKRAMQNNDSEGLRPYLGDAVFVPVARNLAQMKAQHRHALLESLNVRALHLVRAECSAEQHRLQVHYDLVYRAKTLDDDNRILSDEGADTRHGERWTFTRAAGARTPATGGVTASRCPACGAELRLSLDGVCTHCKASVTNGSVDWVVAAVEPAAFVGYSGDGTYAVAAPTVAEGLATLRAADPAFAPDAFLKRVHTAFMTLQDAWCKQNLDSGRAFLSQGAYFAWRAQLETLAREGRRNVMENLSITAVTPLRVVHGRVFDDLTVRIQAASADYEVDGKGHVVFGDRTVRAFVEEWTFQRSVGVQSSGKPGTLENTCPSCGAPVALTQIGECRYCKAAVTSGRFDWVVSRIEQEDEPDGDDADDDDGHDRLALQVGGAIVGGLIGSLLSD